ncbi:hypothetical protein AAON49_06570 [Pseudotenacibaculum sp. MALMAid0570]|uniref:hypothetical protein n=1 Tax=Pseudotenacibaculum sp. MALMAid0570 TaxID=3143938 RepID=UPI0032E04403
MKINKPIFIIIAFLCIAIACKKTEKKAEKETEKVKKKNPCDSPKTVKELLACANTVGTVDSTWVSIGSKFNNGCYTSWNPQDTVLTITYKDSIVLWRVNEHANTPGHYSGSWFTNYSAKAAGLTKEETLDLFALNPCPDQNASWDTCKCPNGKQPIDSVIQYEEKLKIGPNQRMLFGVVGKNPFGKGGQMQWNIINKKTPPYRLLEQIRWE